jgi:hypothetical protein
MFDAHGDTHPRTRLRRWPKAALGLSSLLFIAAMLQPGAPASAQPSGLLPADRAETGAGDGSTAMPRPAAAPARAPSEAPTPSGLSRVLSDLTPSTCAAENGPRWATIGIYVGLAALGTALIILLFAWRGWMSAGMRFGVGTLLGVVGTVVLVRWFIPAPSDTVRECLSNPELRMALDFVFKDPWSVAALGGVGALVLAFAVKLVQAKLLRR